MTQDVNTGMSGNGEVVRTISRRSVVKGAAWSMPVIAAAVAAPISAASTRCEDPVYDFSTAVIVTVAADRKYVKLKLSTVSGSGPDVIVEIYANPKSATTVLADQFTLTPDGLTLAMAGNGEVFQISIGEQVDGVVKPVVGKVKVCLSEFSRSAATTGANRWTNNVGFDPAPSPVPSAYNGTTLLPTASQPIGAGSFDSLDQPLRTTTGYPSQNRLEAFVSPYTSTSYNVLYLCWQDDKTTPTPPQQRMYLSCLRFQMGC